MQLNFGYGTTVVKLETKEMPNGTIEGHVSIDEELALIRAGYHSMRDFSPLIKDAARIVDRPWRKASV